MQGKCPGCDAEGEVGERCDSDACDKRELRYIPEEHHEAIHGRGDGVPDPLVGQLVGDFLVVDLLEVGGFGKVYLALQQPMFRLRGAMKVLEFSTDNRELADAMADKFRREAEVLAEMSHPQIVRLLKYGIHRERPYLVMEYVEGGRTLRGEIDRRAREDRGFGQEELGHIFRQLLNGLEAAHAREIIHRDLKPDNIMLQEIVGDPYHVRILDFGIAKFLEDQSDTKWPLGSPSYMAPEQVSMKNLGTWTDMYALGIMFFELVTGRRPFPGKTKELIMSRKAGDSFDPFERVQDLEIPEPTLDFMQRAIEPDPADRLRTVESFREALDPALEALVEQPNAIGPGGRSLTHLLDSQDIIEIEDSPGPTVEGVSEGSEPPRPPDDSGEMPEDSGGSGSGRSASTGSAPSTGAENSGRPSRVLLSGAATFVIGLAVVVAWVGPSQLIALFQGGTAPPAEDTGTTVASGGADAAGGGEAVVFEQPTDADAGAEADTADVAGGDIGEVGPDGDADVDVDTGLDLPPDGTVELTAGKLHSCQLRADGRFRCWGGNGEGQLGLGHTNRIGDDEPPNAIAPWSLAGPVRRLVSAGDRRSSFNCAIVEDRSLRCWGNNRHGQLGYGHTETIGDDETLEELGPVPLPGEAKDLAVGASPFGSHACALDTKGRIRCWGKAKFGKLGYGHTNTIGDDETPKTIGTVPTGGPVASIDAGKYNTCALLETGDLRCWGWNKHGQLGLGHTETIGDDELPASTEPIEVGGSVRQVAVGRRHVCALLEAGGVRCWGWNEHGQLGLGHTENIGDDEVPASTELIEFDERVVEIGAGSLHVCARLANGDLRCWGDNRLGQLGYGHERTIGDDESPTSVRPLFLGGKARDVAVGRFHNCAALRNGSVRCWGLNSQGQLGLGHTNHIGDDEPPASVSAVPLGD